MPARQDIEFIPRFSILFKTFRGAAADISSFGITFLIVLVGFGLAHACVFGSSVYAFRNVLTAHMSLIRLLVGDMDSSKMVEADFLMGSFFFLVFVTFATLVLLNILISILM